MVIVNKLFDLLSQRPIRKLLGNIRSVHLRINDLAEVCRVVSKISEATSTNTIVIGTCVQNTQIIYADKFRYIKIEGIN